MAGPSDLWGTIVRRLADGWEGLPDKPDETPESTARALWFLATGERRSVAGAEGELPELGPGGPERLEELVTARLRGTPLAYLTGRQSFMGVELLTDPHAMVPRKETELLGGKALELLQDVLTERDHVRILDLCTGSGNLAIALAVHEPRCVVFAGDLTPGAVELARRNAEWCGVEDRVRFFVGDLFEPFENGGFRGTIDLIVCNPPYITSAGVDRLPPEIGDHEPRAAFDGGPMGVGVILRLLKTAPRFLGSGGWLCFEVGAGQGEALLRLLRRGDRYSHAEGVTDDAGRVRVIAARKG